MDVPSLHHAGPAGRGRWPNGEWTVVRVINGGAGHFEGRARFTPDPRSPATIIWQEEGRLRLGAHDGPATRTLRLEPREAGGWQVCFADGRPFHVLDLDGGRGEATHACGADVYRGHFVVEHEERFTITWRVSGPRKDDVIVSRYERAA
jgi:hypothetical protein